MDADDDMILIIVGEENLSKKNLPFALPNHIKEDLDDGDEVTIYFKEEPDDDQEGTIHFKEDSDDDLIETINDKEHYNDHRKGTINIKDDFDDDYKETESDSDFIDDANYGECITEIKVEEYYDHENLKDDCDRKVKDEPVLKNQQSKRNKRKVAASQNKSVDDGDDVTKVPRQSYIEKLLKNFPKMRKDEDYLVAHLTEMMRQTIPPVPPKDFCVEVKNMLVCSYCKFKSATLPIACRHFQKKHGTRYLVCYACGANFKTTLGLYKHEKCCRAPSATLVLKARGRYLGRRGRKRPYLTQNKFEPWSLEKKVSSAAGGAPTVPRFNCSECSASFNHNVLLQSHENMHRGIRPFQCDKCPLAYTSAIGLSRHIRTSHTNIQFICDICGSSFKVKSTLVLHMNTHLSLRKFSCDLCKCRYAQKEGLQRHINRDHLKLPPPLACPACSNRFPRVSNLKLHMKRIHGLLLMTRRMFAKELPSMQNKEVKKATVVFNQLDNNSTVAVRSTELSNSEKSDEKSKSVDDDQTQAADDSLKKKKTKTTSTKNEASAVQSKIKEPKLKSTINLYKDVRKAYVKPNINREVTQSLK